jgi:replicative DNA helicase
MPCLVLPWHVAKKFLDSQLQLQQKQPSDVQREELSLLEVCEADFILAKHRNGPTGTVTVAFQGHYSRFVDMATS